MKTKTLYLALLIFGLGFSTSCSSDDDHHFDNGNINTEIIVGKWAYYKVGYEVDGIEYFGEEYEHSCTTHKDFWEYKSSNNAIQKLFDSDCSIFLEGEFTYALNGNFIIHDYGDDEFEELEIQELNATTLKVRGHEDDFGDGLMRYIVIFKRM